MKLRAPHVFKVLIPSWYNHNPRASGAIGARPDVEFLDRRLSNCVRGRLPKFLPKVKFTFLTLQQHEFVQELFVFNEFFLVAERVLKFFSDNLGNDFESTPVRVEHADGRPASSQYYALKILRTIDCIDPNRSQAREPGYDTGGLPFSDRIVEIELDETVAFDFENAGAGKYISYPNVATVAHVHLDHSKLPNDARLFRPAYWPSALLIEARFAAELSRFCPNGNSSYTFWTLDPASVQDDRAKLMHDLR